MSETEIAVLLERIDGRLNSIDESNSRIETQVNLTNGRVTSLEKWRNIILGAGSMVAIIWTVYTTLFK